MNKVDIPPHILEYVRKRQDKDHAYTRLDPTATALLVVDMQNYFMADGEMACCPHARDIVPNVNLLADTLRRLGGHVVWIQNLASAEAMAGWANMEELFTPEKWKLRRERMQPGCGAYELWSELDVRPEDARLPKSRYSAFIEGSSALEALLRDQGVENVIVAGVATNVCCESTARDAMMRGFRTIMVSDATAAGTDAEHNASLIAFMKYFGDVQHTQLLVDGLQIQQPSGSTADA